MAPSVDETLEDVNQRLDRLLLRVMDDLEDLKEKRQCLNGVIEEGWLCLSQSRYSMGNKSVSSLQYTPEMTPSSFVQDSAADDGGTTFTAERVQPETQDKVTERKLPEVEDIGAADHDGLIVCHLPFGPTAYFTLCNVVMRHDIPDLGTMSEAYPHLVFHNFTSRLGQRVSNIMKYLFPVPKDDSRRVITFANQEDYISFRHHVYKKTDHRNIELSEVGPRFEMKLYMIKLGNLENEGTAEVERRWHPYTNTAKKRKYLTNE
ncbi:U3 small nucleolar ribonucleoprotein IMP4-like [Anomaloglossus baeobatrachus]|uniref:U3 small nucleolar ribonucleoprotein IMP4-like n=1 Tax=Anomaloglossus baeobatrachus TaxID=238106 RepID=UPI003F50686F